MPDGLTKYFMNETNKSLAQIRDAVAQVDQRVGEIHVSVTDLQNFKQTLGDQSKSKAKKISVVASTIGFLMSLAVSVWLGYEEREAILQAARMEVRSERTHPPLAVPETDTQHPSH
jgi:hypothetical protein